MNWTWKTSSTLHTIFKETQTGRTLIKFSIMHNGYSTRTATWRLRCGDYSLVPSTFLKQDDLDFHL